MPRVRNIPGSYRFFFYSFDGNEPKHVHVQRDRKVCKFWLGPLVLCRSHGFSPEERIEIRQIIQQSKNHRELG